MIMKTVWCSLLSTSLIVTFAIGTAPDLPRQCVNYNEIDEESRLFENEDVSTSGDSDRLLAKGWYRFVSKSGNALKEGYSKYIEPSQNAPNFCGTVNAGTLMGSHPTFEEGMTEMTVCFRKRGCFKTNSDCKCERRKTIFVTNCWKFYVYFLVPTNGEERYCSTKLKDMKPIENQDSVECKQNELMSGSRQWDQLGNPTCDKDVHGWYKFDTEMASDCEANESANVTVTLHNKLCSTTFRGWLTDKHPTTDDGRVQRKVCFTYGRKCQCQFYSNVAVRNCGSFFVYRLNGAPLCDGRYCNAPAGRTSKVTDKKKPPVENPKSICEEYKVMYDPDRLWSYTSPAVIKCDADLYGSYRFGSKYTPWAIKEGCNKSDANIIEHRCGSDLHGFMEEKHPNVKDGFVERVICFQKPDQPCQCKFLTKIGVQNCSGFYAYRFMGTPTCPARFCMVANNSAGVTIDTGELPQYSIPPPDYRPVKETIIEKDGTDGKGGLIAATTALSIIILIIIILLILVILLLLFKLYPMYKERKGRQPKYVEQTNADVLDSPTPSKPSASNGALVSPSDSEPSKSIAPYPSEVPQNASTSNQDIPEDLEMNDEDGHDFDTLLRDGDMVRPQSYDRLHGNDSAV